MKGEIECKGIAFLPNSLNKTSFIFQKKCTQTYCANKLF